MILLPVIRGVVVKGCCSTKETAKRWGISVRWVNQYALDGRIPGEERLGRFWAIPEDTVKPESTDPGPSRKTWQREASGRTEHRSTCRAFIFVDKLACANN